MGEPYRIYFTPPEIVLQGQAFLATFRRKTPSLLFNPTIPSTDTQRSYASDFLQTDIRSMTTGAYAVDDAVGLRSCPEPVLGATARASTKGYSSLLEVPSLISKRQEVVAVSISSNLLADISLERPAGCSRNADVLPVKGESNALFVDGLPTDYISLERPAGCSRNADVLPVKGKSNVLFVDGLPTDCTRREVGHIFRPFIGFKEIKVIHKESRPIGDKAMVLCFVEFADAKCALTAMEALQGYKFDNKKPESPALKIHFAHFPFSLPDDRNEHRIGIPR